MTARGEPTRWRDDPSLCPSGTADTLRTYGDQLAKPDERQQLLERLAPLFEAKLPAPVRARRFSRGLGVRIGLVLTVGILTWLVAQSWLHPAAKVRAPAARAASHGAPARVVPNGSANSSVVQPDVTAAAPSMPAADIVKPTSARARGRKGPSLTAPPMAAATNHSPERELELLRKAQQALHRLPDTSEALLAEHARDYPHGIFEQEREMLRIELAVVRGERARARKLVQQFLARFAGSTYQRRLETLLTPNIAQEDQPDVDTQSLDAPHH